MEEDNRSLQYQCAQCGRHPTDSNEIFKGCKCGHRLFRLVRLQIEDSNVPRASSQIAEEGLDFLTIREKEMGVYDINLDQLFQQPLNSNEGTPLVAGTNGIFVIKGLQPKSD